MSVPRQSLLVSASVRRTSRLIGPFPSGFLQQRHNWIRSGISHQAAHPIGPNFNAGAIGSAKTASPTDALAQTNPACPGDHQDPGFLVGIERPDRIRREIDPLKHKMRACNEDGSSGGEMSWGGLSLNRPGMASGDRVGFVQLALPAIVEQSERNVAAPAESRQSTMPAPMA